MTAGELEHVLMDGVVASPGDDGVTREELAKIADSLPTTQFNGGGVEILKAWTSETDGIADDGTPIPAGSLIARVEVVSRDVLKGIDADASAADKLFAAIGSEAVPPFVADLRKSSAALVPVEDDAEPQDAGPSVLGMASAGAATAWGGLIATLEKIASAASTQPVHEVHVHEGDTHVHVPPQDVPEPPVIHNHVNVEARKPVPMRAVPQRDGSRIYEPIGSDA